MKKRKKLIIIIISIIALVLLAVGIYFFHPHSYKESVAKEPTCSQYGEKLFKCWCGKKYTEIIPALEHDYVESVTKEPACTQAGEKTFSCSKCGNTYTEAILPLGHDYMEKVAEATCTADGQRIKTCSRCGDTLAETIPALGHDYKVIEDTDVKTVYECKNCGDVYAEEKKKVEVAAPKEEKPDKGSDTSSKVDTSGNVGNGWFDLEGTGDGSAISRSDGSAPPNIIFY